MHLLKRIGGARGRLAAFGGVVVVLGAVACNAANMNLPSASVPAQPAGTVSGKAVQPLAPTTAPAAAPTVVVGGAPVPAPAAPAQTSSSGSAASTVTDASTAQSLDRMIIRTAQLTVEVPDIEQALAQARQIASRGGGIVSTSNTHIERVNDQDRMVADLTLQVRSDSADAAISELRALGKVTGEASGSQDVTEEYVDLGSNLRNLQASESAILKLMDKASQIQDVLQLQRELTNVRGQIERIQGRKTYLERRSDMATITLALRLPPLEAASQPSNGAWDPAGAAQRGWQASLLVLRGVANVFIVAIAFSWWLVPFAALAGGLWYRRRRRPTATPAPTAGQP